MSKVKHRIHNHPIWERKLGLKDHVIIDADVFHELFATQACVTVDRVIKNKKENENGNNDGK